MFKRRVGGLHSPTNGSYVGGGYLPILPRIVATRLSPSSSRRSRRSRGSGARLPTRACRRSLRECRRRSYIRIIRSHRCLCLLMCPKEFRPYHHRRHGRCAYQDQNYGPTRRGIFFPDFSAIPMGVKGRRRRVVWDRRSPKRDDHHRYGGVVFNVKPPATFVRFRLPPRVCRSGNRTSVRRNVKSHLRQQVPLACRHQRRLECGRSRRRGGEGWGGLLRCLRVIFI